MARGIIDWIGLVGTLVVAVPIGFMGVDFLLAGEVLGAALLAIAVAAVLVMERATRPSDVPGSLASRVVGRVAKPPEEED